MHEFLRHWMWVFSGISLHAGKTKVWNRSGVPPPGSAMLQRIAASSLPDAVVWRGDHSLPPHEQGFKVLGVPFGHPEFVKKFLQNKNSEHKVLLDRIPAIQDTQSAWLLLSFCAAARSNFFLRAVSPQFVWQCLCRILSVHVDCGAQEQSSLPFMGRWHRSPERMSDSASSTLGKLG